MESPSFSLSSAAHDPSVDVEQSSLSLPLPPDQGFRVPGGFDTDDDISSPGAEPEPEPEPELELEPKEVEEAEEVEEVEEAGVEEGCSRNEPMDGDERGNKGNTGDAVRAATTTGEAATDGQHHNHNINENSISDNDDADDAKEMNGRDTHSEGETAVQQQLDHDASITSFPSLPPHPITTDRDESVIGRAEAAVEGEESSLLISSETDDLHRQNNQTLVEEKEMQRKLMDMESSFVPEPSTIEVAPVGGDGLPTTGADDTYLVGVPTGGNQDALATTTTTTIDREEAQLEETVDIEDEELEAAEEESRIPDATPEDAVTEGDMRTPAVGHGVAELDGQQEQHQGYSESENAREEGETTLDLDITPILPSESGEGNTSMLEIPASSPTAAAAARTESRGLISATSTDGEVDEPTGRPSHLNVQNEDIDDATPKSKRTLSPAWPGPLGPFGDSNNGNENDDDSSTPASERKRTRPRYLTSRQSIHRFSTSSVNSTTTDTTTSDATLGADYALQSGGAVPGNSQGVTHKDLSRSISLGSMASGISGYSDESPFDKRNFSGVTDGVLHTLDEEDPSPQSRPQSSSKELNSGNPAPETPRAKPRDPTFPPDTVVIDHVKDIQVPATSSFSRQFRENYGPGLTPDKRAGAPTPGFGRSGKNMTLKEQSSTIDRLSKENFDLKMRIHFLNEALNKRSEEGIKEMISENVELKSDKLKLQKENQGLKRTVRDLEKQLKDRDQQSDKDSMVNHDPAASDDEDRNIAAEEEIFYLKERIETYETEIERLRSESLVRESEKRRLAEMVKTLGERSVVGSEVGSREERVRKVP
jgi:centrosomin-like protein